jgi:hypothetical protein
MLFMILLLCDYFLHLRKFILYFRSFKQIIFKWFYFLLSFLIITFVIQSNLKLEGN